MGQPVKRRVVIQKGGRVELRDASLPEGRMAEVTVEVAEEAVNGNASSFLAMRGAAKGGFTSGEDVDAFLRRERDAWE